MSSLSWWSSRWVPSPRTRVATVALPLASSTPTALRRTRACCARPSVSVVAITRLAVG
uniref:Uncharacterized protein n=1 Tax=uncultured marine virus TaxID=186617 RepID=A0A0F7L6W9_9VIRU|nr:hypothetical protein [uncultured marine virus]